MNKDYRVALSITKRVIDGFKEQGNPVTMVRTWDGDATPRTTATEDILALIVGHEQVSVHTASGDYVELMLCNGWDAIYEWNRGGESVARSVQAWIDSEELF